MVNDYLSDYDVQLLTSKKFSEVVRFQGLLFCFATRKQSIKKCSVRNGACCVKKNQTFSSKWEEFKDSNRKHHFKVRINNYERVFLKVISSEKCGIG